MRPGLLFSRIYKNTRPNFMNFSVRVICGRGLVLWRQCFVLLVLWMTSRLPIMCHGAWLMGRILKVTLVWYDTLHKQHYCFQTWH